MSGIIDIAAQTVFSVNEDGTAAESNVKVMFDLDRFQFRIDPPSHLNNGEAIFHNIYEGVIENYQSACDEYQRKRLQPQATKMLSVNRGLSSPELLRDVFGLQGSVSLGYSEVFVVDGCRVFARTGDSMGRGVSAAVLVPDTPEVRAKLDSLIDSINVARGVLAGFDQAADATAYLLAISNDLSSSTEVIRAPDQPELPFDAHGDDDEEL